MFDKIRNDYGHTIKACYIGYITQAIVNNFAPLLFLTFASEFNLSLDKITLITTINFLVQLLIDAISAGIVPKIGTRNSIIIGHICAVLGLVVLAVVPPMLTHPFVGIILAVVLYAIGGGVTEVMLSPVVEACPTEKKEAAMSVLHSFYCWGHVAVVVISTIFFSIFGTGNWRIMALLWALVPLFNIFYFCLVPLYPVVAEESKQMSFKELVMTKAFWLIVILMVCSGASEQAVSQWTSSFAESVLSLPKSVGDLVGTCMFALLMGLARLIYGKFSDRLPLKKTMCAGAILCIISYAMIVFSPWPVLGLAGCALTGFAVGIFWPGTFSIAAEKIPGGGVAMYALLALAGDLGCAGGPTVTGMVANGFSGNLKMGIMIAAVFPVVMLLGLLTIRKNKKI